MFIAPNHIRLISSCFPAAPLSASPDFRPNAHELSRLTYYGSNHPGKLSKLAGELEKRAQSDARRASTGNAKSRASLLITLAILKALCTECRRDISLFARSVIAAVDYALAALPSDLEVAARSASLFTAYTTFTDGKASGVDENLIKSYTSALSKFTKLSVWDKKGVDPEIRNRTRLVGLAALTGAVSSDALYSSIEGAKAQVSIIVPALLRNAQQAGLELLKEQEPLVEEPQASSSAYFSEFQPERPVAQRRAASIHLHVDGESGPSFTDVTYAALRASKILLTRSDGPQVSTFLQALFSTLSLEADWGDVELCCWLAHNITDWTQYQHRYAVPVGLISKLVDTKDDAQRTGIHEALVSMITVVFSARTPIANLSTSDALTSLLGVLLRRIGADPHDLLRPHLVKCIASLGTHLYYADQIHDLAEELIHRLIGVQINGRTGDDMVRTESLKGLIACLAGLIQVATSRNEERDRTRPSSPTPSRSPGRAEGHRNISYHSDSEDSRYKHPKRGGTAGSIGGRRNPISPEVWQESLALLCEADRGVRSEYARTLALFIRSEIPTETSWGRSDSEHGRTLRVGRHAPEPILELDETTRFLHALHASAYMLAVSPSLGLSSNLSTDPTQLSSQNQVDDTINSHINVISSTPVMSPAAELDASAMLTQRKPVSGDVKRGSSRSRTASLALSLFESVPTQLVSPAPCPATPDDYSRMVAILSSAYERTPSRALLTGVPMLLALDKATCAPLADKDAVAYSRRLALREAVAQIWGVISLVLDSPEIKQLSEEALASLPKPYILPTMNETQDSFVQPPDITSSFPIPDLTDRPDAFAALSPIIDAEKVLPELASSSKLRTATKLDRQGLLRRFTAPWSAAAALAESSENFPSFENGPRLDGSMPFLKLSPALMHIDNKSLQSLARSSRNVGVGDLREALEGRASANRSATALGYTPSLSSIGHASATADGSAVDSPSTRSRLHSMTKAAGNGEVKDILNKLGIGKQQSERSRGVFKSPLPPKRPSSQGNP